MTTTVTHRGSLWRNRDFMLLWSGQTASALGSRITATALPLLVLAMTGSPATAGVVGFVGTLPYLLVSLPAGTLVDRWNRWHTMLICDLGRLTAVATVPLALWLDGLTVPQLAVVAFLETTFVVFFELAETAALPHIVATSQLPAALAQNEAKTRGASLAGQPVGGVLYGIGQALPYLADLVSYVFSTATLLLMRRKDLRPVRSAPPGSIRQETAVGLRWLAGHAFLRNATLLVAGSNLIFQALILTVIVRAAEQDASPALIGVVLGCWGVGGLLGSLLAPRVQPMLPPRIVVIGVNWVWLALIPLMLLPDDPLLIGAIGGATAFVGPLWNVVVGAYQLTLVPDELRGRVRSIGTLVAAGGIPIGSLVGGLLLEWYGTTGAIWALSGLMLVIAVLATASPSVRRPPPLPN